jgi:hypothetical protein
VIIDGRYVFVERIIPMEPWFKEGPGCWECGTVCDLNHIGVCDYCHELDQYLGPQMHLPSAIRHN